ncbi:Putative NADH:cytochrome b5 reductase, FAD-binding domain, ferredoxin reductase-type [Septoria linicola]|uniref:NADH:cytochrome b5 reductase, FAD-binding domain, ferredoxin reductase-type n=1 Tax=Septoria linicola TaxID=215465 RepID=A0A9Q9EL30_9PEZI|nr:putative NADH:cytochrome b5 reductase, FAD-binding domain, ferredoxin reductase-type [Septoria linicola]USW52998.1 Putative NADH:cytochrome b5 reductase, FAD-binding domain, ferredoxin reductase-type [Septoria linicola]
MSLSAGVWRNLGRGTAVRPGGIARFSQCGRHAEDKVVGKRDAGGQAVNDGAAKGKPLQDQPSDERPTETRGPTLAEERQQKNEEQDKKRHTREEVKKKVSFGFPSLALFAVGLPLGYCFSDYLPRRKASSLSSPSEFVKYTLIGKDNVSSTCAIFRLKPSTGTAVDLDDPGLERAITSVEFKQPQLQIARSYTCLPQEDGQHEDELRFLIRREQKGEVSNFLHRLPENAELETRGLHPEFVLPDNVNSVAFLVGGTGIAPASQAADILAGQADVHILWASRRREDCIGGYNDTQPENKSTGWNFWGSAKPAKKGEKVEDLPNAEKGALVTLLESLKKRSAGVQGQNPRLQVDYYIDEEGSFIRPEDVKRMLYRLSRSQKDSDSGRNILFVSGPEGFLSYWAGSKQWSNGREVQGPLRGVLSTLDLSGWDVVKL